MEDENQELGSSGKNTLPDRARTLRATEADGVAGQPWIRCADRLPENGIVVLTKIDDADGCRNEQTLVRRGGLWFTGESGDAMYVYYTPTHWKPVTSATGDNNATPPQSGVST